MLDPLPAVGRRRRSSAPLADGVAPGRRRSTSASTNAATIAAMAMKSPLRGRYWLTSRRTTNAAAGSAGSSQASSMPNPLMVLSSLQPSAPADAAHHLSASTSSTFAVPRFRNTRRTMPSARPTSAAAMVITKMAKMMPDEQRRRRVDGEGDEVDAHGVQHQLDRHQDQHGVAPRQHAVDADREEDRAEHEEVLQRDLLRDTVSTYASPSSCMAMTMAPTSATSSTTRRDLERHSPAAEERVADGRRTGSTVTSPASRGQSVWLHIGDERAQQRQAPRRRPAASGRRRASAGSSRARVSISAKRMSIVTAPP